MSCIHGTTTNPNWSSAKPANGTQPIIAAPPGASSFGKKYKTTSEHIAEAPPAVLDLCHAVTAYLEAAGDDVQIKMNDNYVAFRRLKNFACVELRNQLGKLLVYVRVNPDSVTIEPGFTRDVRGIGHHGTGDLELTIQSMRDVEKAKPMFDAGYQNA